MINTRSILYVLILLLLAYAAYGALNLSLEDYRVKDVCPKILGIPACYLVFLSFALLVPIQLLKAKKLYFFLVLAFPLLLALGASGMELAGIEVCPRNEAGTPMCYYSLAFCTTVLVLKLLEIRAPKASI